MALPGVTNTRLLVLGASGGTGRCVVAQALERGFHVTALVRHPDRLAIRSDRLEVVTASVTEDDAALADAMRGQDAVISAIGVGKSFKSNNLIAEAMPRIVDALESARVRRIIFTSAFGVGETRRDAPLVPRLFMSTLLRDVYRDKEAGEAILRRSNLEWTLVYPTGLSDRQATGRWRAGERLSLHGFPTIARADVASFLLAQVEDRTWLRKGVLVSS